MGYENTSGGLSEQRAYESRKPAEKLDKLTYVDTAESVIRSLQVQDKYTGRIELRVTTSKIRGILSMVAELYNDAVHVKGKTLDEDMQSRVQYLRMRMAYEAGRDKDVEWFVKKANLLEHIKQIGTEKENLILFCRYMEALVAYHKFLGGRD